MYIQSRFIDTIVEGDSEVLKIGFLKFMNTARSKKTKPPSNDANSIASS